MHKLWNNLSACDVASLLKIPINVVFMHLIAIN